MRYLCWFSAGAASAVATKLTLATHKRDDVTIYRVDPGSEHPDNARFASDCEQWFDHPVQLIRSGRYRDTWQVWTERRYINGPPGALCTVELKKKPRLAVELPDDVQLFGYTVEERHRADRFRDQNPGVDLVTPLIDAGLTKSDCLAMIDRAGITLPAMYLLGYRNNNCIGCPKGGMGYWNKIRRDFPATFDRMAALERDLDASCINGVFLDELDPDRGSHSDDPDFECSLMCALAEDVLS
jgi:3'-phosphoadenosine 5'-phosphosulfate sulfotransferase (PAPS reductase)/FAD synthetase